MATQYTVLIEGEHQAVFAVPPMLAMVHQDISVRVLVQEVGLNAPGLICGTGFGQVQIDVFACCRAILQKGQELAIADGCCAASYQLNNEDAAREQVRKQPQIPSMVTADTEHQFPLASTQTVSWHSALSQSMHLT
jgi:hypothetical protein